MNSMKECRYLRAHQLDMSSKIGYGQARLIMHSSSVRIANRLQIMPQIKFDGSLIHNYLCANHHIPLLL